MADRFHQRFNIEVGIEDAKRRFVNRVHNAVWKSFMKRKSVTNLQRFEFERNIITLLGDRYDSNESLGRQIGGGFLRNLEALESLYRCCSLHDRQEVNQLIEFIMSESEVDLGVRWERGRFLPSGAPVLDEKLVNDVLGLVNTAAYKGVLHPFVKGIDHFVRAMNSPDLLSDVITDMYESLEAMAKIVNNNDRDLAANRQMLVSNLSLSESYKRMLKEYVEYVNILARHAGKRGEAKQRPSRREVEAFVYLTGLFLRLALSKET